MRRLGSDTYDRAAFDRVQELHTEAAFVAGLQRVVHEELERAGKPIAR
jgi:hypothetical protein